MTQWFHFWEFIQRNPKTNLKEYKHPIFIEALFTIADMEAAQLSMDRVDEITMGHLHNGILLRHKKEDNLILWKNMNGPGEHYAKWNKPVRERQIPYDLTYMRNLMNKLINKQNRDRLIDGEQDDS